VTTLQQAGEDASDRVAVDVPSGVTWWVCAAIGALLMAYGAVGLLRDLDPPGLVRWVLWFVGALAVHDFVVAPLYVAGGGLVSRALPPRARAPLQAAALVTGALLFGCRPRPW